MSKPIRIELTREEAEKVATLLGNITGRLQYRATQRPSGELDEHWRFWHGITKKVAASIGFEAFIEPCKTVSVALGDDIL